LYLYNNSVLLTQSTATASCTSGTGWNGSSCVTNANGVCGSGTGFANGKTYPYNWPGYGTDAFCASGTQSPSVISFPAPNGTANWQCLHINSGTDAICSASQYGPPVLTASPATIAKGASSKLTWTSNAATCTGPFNGATNLNPSNLANNSTGVTVQPTTTTNYSITCSDGNTAPATVTVTVKIKPKFKEN
jgi:hypothetical protein